MARSGLQIMSASGCRAVYHGDRADPVGCLAAPAATDCRRRDGGGERAACCARGRAIDATEELDLVTQDMLIGQSSFLDGVAAGGGLWQGDGVAMPWLQADHVPGASEDEALAVTATMLAERGVARVLGRWPDQAVAWRVAFRIAEHARVADLLCAGLPRLEVVGEFTLPPPGTVQRDFQALHIDYGVPKLAG